MSPAFWRKWHRWIGFPAALFLAYAAITGTMVAFTEKFGEEEALREATRDLVSPVTLGGDPAAWQASLSAAFAAAKNDAGDLPVDRVRIDFKGDAPKIHIFTGKPTGGEDREFVLDATIGELARHRILCGQAVDQTHPQRRGVRRWRSRGRDVVGTRARGIDGDRHCHLPENATEERDGVEAHLLVRLT